MLKIKVYAAASHFCNVRLFGFWAKIKIVL